MPSIQQRNWQEIDEPEIYGEQREQLNERQCAQRRNLSGKLSDLDRTTDVLARALADNQLAGAFEYCDRDAESVRNCQRHRLTERYGGRSDAKQANLDLFAGRILNHIRSDPEVNPSNVPSPVE